ncbi:MAG: hypothetical protein LBV49_05565 [Azonexus sp.]|nr:hypothetical protein [Azonexus sp.]
MNDQHGDAPGQPAAAKASGAAAGNGDDIVALRQLVIGVIVFFVLTGGLATMIFDYANRSIAESLGRDTAKRQAQFDHERIVNLLQTDLTLARRLADSPLLLKWALDENNPALKRAALAELESYRHYFRGGSYFFIPRASGNYYHNDENNTYPGGGLAQVILPGKVEHAWYFAAIDNPEQVQLNVDRNPALARTNVWINIQMRHYDQVVAMVGSGIDLNEFTRTVATSTASGAYGILASADGAIQIHPDTSLIDFNSGAKRPNLRHTIFDLLASDNERRQLRESFDRLRRGSSSVEVLRLTIAGHAKLVGVDYVKEIGWFNLALVDTAQLIRNREFFTLGLLIGGALLLIVLVVLTPFAQKLLRPSR